MRNVCLIDKEGNLITAEGIKTHYDLASLIFEKNPELLKEYKMSKIQDQVDFFVFEKGYIKLTERMFYKRCVFSSSKISSKQRKILEYYLEEGFEIDDLDIINMGEHTKE